MTLLLILHADIKPGNVLLAQPSKKGEGVQAKLIDLGGVADLNADVREDEAIFDPTYGAPEQFNLVKGCVASHLPRPSCSRATTLYVTSPMAQRYQNRRSGERTQPLQQHSQHQHHIKISSSSTRPLGTACYRNQSRSVALLPSVLSLPDAWAQLPRMYS